MHYTEGQYSFLPALSDEQITAQVAYAFNNNCAIYIEYTDNPDRRGLFWCSWGTPVFDPEAPESVLDDIRECRRVHGDCYIRLLAYDRRQGKKTPRMAFMVHRPGV